MDRLDAAHWAERFLRAQPQFGSATVSEVFKMTPSSWVLLAHVDGEKAVVKRYFDTNAAARIDGLKRELDHLERVFGEGDCQANRCLGAWPADGVALLSFAPGPRLDDAIAASAGAARRDLLAHSGRWLRRYATGRQRADTFGPRYWIRQMEGRDLSGVATAQDRALLPRLQQHLRDRIETVKGCAIVKAATHGDFAGINLHVNDGVICGVDIQGESWLALAREVARFLVWLQIRDNDRASPRRHGIAAADWHALLSSGVLSEQEQETTLPFFVAEQLAGRFVESYRHHHIRANTRAAIEAYLG